jgi:hypothetical protein
MQNSYVLISASQLDRLKLAVKCWEALRVLHKKMIESQPILEALTNYNKRLEEYIAANDAFIEASEKQQAKSLN